jgi:hypothetical protein
MRISIRPVTLRRIIETLDLSLKMKYVNSTALAAKLGTTRRRGQEILLEIQRMRFLEGDGNDFSPNKDAVDFVEAFNREDWQSMHAILSRNYPFYRIFIDALQTNTPGKSFTKSDLAKTLVNEPQLNFNATAIDVLCDWSERLGAVQRNPYTNMYYLANNTINFAEFIAYLHSTYEELNVKPRPGLRQEYVEIARLRENVCEKSNIRREIFDSFFTEVFKRAYGKMELCGAPITSIAKNSPSSIKKMEKGLRDSILSPQFVCLREASGIEINGKEYYYLAIFDSLR